MNRRVVVFAISIVTALGVATVALFYPQFSMERKSISPPADPSVLVRSHSPVIGPVTARVTIVEFFDPSCGACRVFHPVVKQVMAKHPGDVRLVMRYVLFHEGSEAAARIIEAAHRQGFFVPVLEAVLEDQPAWQDDPKAQGAWEAAAAAGLDVEKARKVVMSPEIDALLSQDMADAKTFGVHRTPTLFVNGKLLAKLGKEPLQALVQSEIERAAQ